MWCSSMEEGEGKFLWLARDHVEWVDSIPNPPLALKEGQETLRLTHSTRPGGGAKEGVYREDPLGEKGTRSHSHLVIAFPPLV